MLIVLLTMIVVAIITDDVWINKILSGTIIGGFVGLFLWVLIIGPAVGLMFEQNKVVKEFKPVITSKDNFGVGGTLFTVNQKQKLNYYYKDNGYIKSGSVKLSYVKIIETDKRTPALIKYGWRFSDKTNYLWAMAGLSSHYILRVPEGTVKNEFILNAE
jgi:hypothetical protein